MGRLLCQKSKFKNVFYIGKMHLKYLEIKYDFYIILFWLISLEDLSSQVSKSQRRKSSELVKQFVKEFGSEQDKVLKSMTRKECCEEYDLDTKQDDLSFMNKGEEYRCL